MLLLLLANAASAAAYYFLDTGTRGLARAGAYIASVDDLSAQYYNPAALIRLKEPQVYINFSLVGQQVDFTRIDYDSSGAPEQTYDTVSNGDPAMPIPAFGFSSHFGLEDTVFAFGVYPPFAPTLGYPEEGAQRYTLIDSMLIQLYAGPSVAHRLSDWLSVGAGLVWTPFQISQSLSLTTCGDPELCGPDNSAYDGDPAGDPTYDIDIAVEMTDLARFSANAGLLIEPSDTVAIGLSVVPPIKVRGKGSLTADFGEDHYLVANELLTESTFTDDDVTVMFTMPWIFRLGTALYPTERFELEVAGVLQTWRMTEEIRVTDMNLEMGINQDSTLLALAPSDVELPATVSLTDDVVLPAGFDNAWSVRLGGELAIRPALEARAGVAYEGGAVPPSTQSVSQVDGNKLIYGVGGSYTIAERIGLDVGLSQTFIQARSIKNSAVQQIVVPLFPIPLDDVSGHFNDLGIEQGEVVGNGEFSSNLTFLSAGMTYTFR